MQSGPRHNQEIDFPQAQRLLFILTGIEPIKHNGTIDKIHEGEHLRFVFKINQSGFDMVVAMLKILDIQHCSELFKNSTRETYITVSKMQFDKLYSYFAPGAFVNIKNAGNKVDIFEYQGLQSAIINILFNSSVLDGIKTRNQNEYNLDGLMRYFSQLLINTAPCFAYLKEQGVTAELTLSLEIDDDEALTPTRAITPLRTNQNIKRESPSTPGQLSDAPSFKRATKK